MREDWALTTLKEVILPKNNIKWDSVAGTKKYIDLSSVDRNVLQILETDTINAKNAPSRAKQIVREGDVLFGTTRPQLRRVTIVPAEYDEQICSTGFTILRSNSEKIISEYIFYLLQSEAFMDEMSKLERGTSYPAVTDKDVKGFEFNLPPLPEQKRIVAMLDEAFEAIDQAKANIERNIENAEELFQSKLNEIFSQRGEGWVTEKLSNVFRMKSGDQLSKKNVIPGPYPVYGGNGITAHHKEYNLEGQQVLIGRVGAQCGNVHLTDEKIWLTDNAFKVTDLKYEFDFEFLEHLLRVKDLRQTARQSAQPVISNSSCKNVQLDFPENITQQNEIAELVNALDSEVLQINEAYKTKLLALEELKKSILKKAFSGELTANEHVAA